MMAMMAKGMMGKGGPGGPDGCKGKGKAAAMMGMMAQMMAAKGKGKAQQEQQDQYWQEYKPGYYYEEPGGKVGIEGLRDAVTRATEPHLSMENSWNQDLMVNKICLGIYKPSLKWFKEDHRHNETGPPMMAQALIEEFTEKIMAALNSQCYDKVWFHDIYLSEAIALAAISIFKQGTLFKRTVAPIVVTHVDEAIFRYREEERQTRVMWEAVQAVGIKPDYQKKANKHLTTSFEAAHISAKYGTSPSITPELGMVQDFVQAWLSEFTHRAWDVLHNGLHVSTPDQQIAVVTALFQFLCNPHHSCLPVDLTRQLDTPPPENWDFVATATLLCMSEH
jgi:hypothetical protein